MDTYWGMEVVPVILNLSTRWRWKVIFTLRPLYPRGKRPGYQLDRRLGEFQVPSYDTISFL